MEYPSTLPSVLSPMIQDSDIPQGDVTDVKDHPTHNFSDRVQLAGDVIPASDAFRNMQQSNAISRTLPGVDNSNKPKADVIPLRVSPLEKLFKEVNK